ncbi:MAG TPA: hypothetical protein VHD81_01830 [Mycobacteriales bacterium]|nr:hypothetical protein [Mycobacteriales bacterium]
MRSRAAILVALVMCAGCGTGTSGGGAGSADQLSVRSLGGGQPECEGTFAPGQSVEISDPGFAPGAEVTLEITPDGGGAHTSITVADEHGAINTTTQLPQAAGQVSVRASGFGPTGMQVDDSATVDVRPPGNSCD